MYRNSAFETSESTDAVVLQLYKGLLTREESRSVQGTELYVKKRLSEMNIAFSIWKELVDPPSDASPAGFRQLSSYLFDAVLYRGSLDRSKRPASCPDLRCLSEAELEQLKDSARDMSKSWEGLSGSSTSSDEPPPLENVDEHSWEDEWLLEGELEPDGRVTIGKDIFEIQDGDVVVLYKRSTGLYTLSSSDGEGGYQTVAELLRESGIQPGSKRIYITDEAAGSIQCDSEWDRLRRAADATVVLSRPCTRGFLEEPTKSKPTSGSCRQQ